MGWDEQGIRLSGWLLELLGIGVVAKGLSDSRQLFRLPWLKPPPPFRNRTVNLKAEGGVSTPNSGVLEGLEVVKLESQPGLETRIWLLEKNLSINIAQVSELNRKLQVATQTLSESLEAERVDRLAETGKIQEQLRKAVVGGINLEAVGIVWLACGVTLSSLSQELACLMAS
jgi:hypothetical protein